MRDNCRPYKLQFSQNATYCSEKHKIIWRIGAEYPKNVVILQKIGNYAFDGAKR